MFLVFFCVLACSKAPKISGVTVQYDAEKRPVSVTFNGEGVQPDLLEIALGASQTPVLGRSTVSENHYTFQPVIAFTQGETYEIRVGGESMAQFTVPFQHSAEAPKLLRIYPTSDSVPENLLKMHFYFDRPMQAVGKVLHFITVTEDATGDSVSIFLDMEAELWNSTHDRLTLWLDPGRIKTDLIPNREKGLPLIQGKSYTIRVSADWKAANGQKLEVESTKSLRVHARDDKRPNIGDWRLELPKSNSRDPLRIVFNEILDSDLAVETLSVQTADGRSVAGNYRLLEGETAVTFTPDSVWSSGRYILKVESRLEDLAGNNLNRLFDTDVQQGSSSRETIAHENYQREFELR